LLLQQYRRGNREDLKSAKKRQRDRRSKKLTQTAGMFPPAKQKPGSPEALSFGNPVVLQLAQRPRLSVPDDSRAGFIGINHKQSSNQKCLLIRPPPIKQNTPKPKKYKKEIFKRSICKQDLCQFQRYLFNSPEDFKSIQVFPNRPEEIGFRNSTGNCLFF
jgi:hypothetical protein